MKKPDDGRKKSGSIADGFIKLGIITVIFGASYILFFLLYFQGD